MCIRDRSLGTAESLPEASQGPLKASQKPPRGRGASRSFPTGQFGQSGSARIPYCRIKFESPVECKKDDRRDGGMMLWPGRSACIGAVFCPRRRLVHCRRQLFWPALCAGQLAPRSSDHPSIRPIIHLAFQPKGLACRCKSSGEGDGFWIECMSF